MADDVPSTQYEELQQRSMIFNTKDPKYTNDKNFMNLRNNIQSVNLIDIKSDINFSLNNKNSGIILLESSLDPSVTITFDNLGNKNFSNIKNDDMGALLSKKVNEYENSKNKVFMFDLGTNFFNNSDDTGVIKKYYDSSEDKYYLNFDPVFLRNFRLNDNYLIGISTLSSAKKFTFTIYDENNAWYYSNFDYPIMRSLSYYEFMTSLICCTIFLIIFFFIIYEYLI